MCASEEGRASYRGTRHAVGMWGWAALFAVPASLRDDVWCGWRAGCGTGSKQRTGCCGDRTLARRGLYSCM